MLHQTTLHDPFVKAIVAAQLIVILRHPHLSARLHFAAYVEDGAARLAVRGRTILFSRHYLKTLTQLELQAELIELGTRID